MTDPIIRANQWKLAYQEEGGLGDIFTAIRKAYFERAGKLDPTLPLDVRTAALESLSRASHVVDMVDDHVRAIIDNGKIEEQSLIYAEKIADLPPAKRKWAGWR